jgi:hypothetical protein
MGAIVQQELTVAMDVSHAPRAVPLVELRRAPQICGCPRQRGVSAATLAPPPCHPPAGCSSLATRRAHNYSPYVTLRGSAATVRPRAATVPHGEAGARASGAAGEED